LTAPLTSDQRDALQEITNVAMGQAGTLLANLLDTFVHLSVPRINVLGVADVAGSIGDMVGHDHDVIAVRQSFQGYLLGEAIVIYGREGCKELADIMGYHDELDRSAEIELLLDVANILVGACLGGIIEQLRDISEENGVDELGFSAPSLMADGVPPETLINPDKLTWAHALMMEVNFKLESRNFVSHLIMLMPDKTIGKMRGILDEFITSL
jgi:chemotaxis protein CheC